MPRTLPVYQVDAFTDRPFGGNPAAVMPLDTWPADDWMQRVAREMNLSETAFLVPERTETAEGGPGVAGGTNARPGDNDDSETFGLRWFTPAVEVVLCGHATLASAHTLWETGRIAPAAPARFMTKSGALTCRRDGAWITMDFPAKRIEPDTPPPALLQALGAATIVACGRNAMDWLIELADEEAVRSLQPDCGAIKRVPARGIIVTARAARPPHDFVSRFFAPGAGIDEDPVTGSAHCALAPYWAAKLGRDSLTGWQASARGGEVRVRAAGNRVFLSGQAVTVMRGELIVPEDGKN